MYICCILVHMNFPLPPVTRNTTCFCGEDFGIGRWRTKAPTGGHATETIKIWECFGFTKAFWCFNLKRRMMNHFRGTNLCMLFWYCMFFLFQMVIGTSIFFECGIESNLEVHHHPRQSTVDQILTIFECFVWWTFLQTWSSMVHSPKKWDDHCSRLHPFCIFCFFSFLWFSKYQPSIMLHGHRQS